MAARAIWAGTAVAVLWATAAAAQVPALAETRVSPARDMNIAVAPAEVLHVQSTGTGDAIVIVPGLFGSAFGFRRIVAPLAADGYRVIVVEPLGIGASARPEGADYSLEAQAKRVGAVLDTLGVSSALFIGHSVGSSVVLRLALARPALVRSIVSIEGGISEAAGTPGLRKALSLAGFLGHFGLQGMVRSKLRSKFRDSSGDPSWITDDVMAGYLAPLRDRYSEAIDAYKAMASAPERTPLAPRLPQLRCPETLLLGGAPHDGGIGAQELATMRARIPSLSVETVPGVGHWIQEERPQAVVAAVLAMARRGLPAGT